MPPRRTAPLVEALRAQGYETDIRQRTGLVLDAYFSATKVRWLLDHVQPARAGCTAPTLPMPPERCYTIHTDAWDDDILRALDIPASLLPEVRDSSGDFGVTACFRRRRAAHRRRHRRPAGHPLRAGVFAPGMVKNTYGTGSFVLMHNGDAPGPVHGGLLTTMEA